MIWRLWPRIVELVRVKVRSVGVALSEDSFRRAIGTVMTSIGVVSAIRVTSLVVAPNGAPWFK